MKTTVALIEKGEDGTYGIYTPDLQSVIVGEGETVEEAKDDFENSVIEVRKAFSEKRKTLPKELQELKFIYKFDVASLFNYIDCINVSKFAQIAGISPSLMRQYKSGNTYISEKQAAKIESSLHDLGKKLMQVSLCK